MSTLTLEDLRVWYDQIQSFNIPLSITVSPSSLEKLKAMVEVRTLINDLAGIPVKTSAMLPPDAVMIEYLNYFEVHFSDGRSIRLPKLPSY